MLWQHCLLCSEGCIDLKSYYSLAIGISVYTYSWFFVSTTPRFVYDSYANNLPWSGCKQKLVSMRSVVCPQRVMPIVDEINEALKMTACITCKLSYLNWNFFEMKFAL